MWNPVRTGLTEMMFRRGLIRRLIVITDERDGSIYISFCLFFSHLQWWMDPNLQWRVSNGNINVLSHNMAVCLTSSRALGQGAKVKNTALSLPWLLHDSSGTPGLLTALHSTPETHTTPSTITIQTRASHCPRNTEWDLIWR